MKTLIIIATMLFLSPVNSFSQTIDIQKILENKEKRTELFNAVVNSHEYMTDFMHIAKENEHAMMMMNNISKMGQQHQMGMNKSQSEMHSNHQMMGNNNEMGMMMNHPEQMQKMMEHMMNMCDQDSSLRNEMSGVILKYPKMMEMMNMHVSNTTNSMDHRHNMNSKLHQHK